MNREKPSFLPRTCGVEHFTSLMLKADYLFLRNMPMSYIFGWLRDERKTGFSFNIEGTYTKHREVIVSSYVRKCAV